MPCDAGPSKAYLLKEGRKKIDMLTRYLCGVLKYREFSRSIPDIEDATPGIEPGEIEGWFHAHCEQDKEREKLNLPSVGL